MPMPFHTWVEGKTQGPISGSDGVSDIQGREDSILCQALDHTVSIPRDPQTGLPTGKRVHHPLKFTMQYNQSVPLLYQALCSGEQFTKFEAKFYRIEPGGTEQHYFTIELREAIIIDMRNWIATCLDPNLEHLRHMVDVAWTYKNIIWRWEDGGIESEDNWAVPR